MESFIQPQCTPAARPLDAVQATERGASVTRCDWDTACDACQDPLPCGELLVTWLTVPPVYAILCVACGLDLGVVVDVLRPIPYELTARGHTALVGV